MPYQPHLSPGSLREALLEAFLAAGESDDPSRLIDELAAAVSALAPLDRFLTLLIVGNRPLVWEPRLTSLCRPEPVTSVRDRQAPVNPDPGTEQLLRIVVVTMDPKRMRLTRILTLLEASSQEHEQIACLVEEVNRKPRARAWAFPFRTGGSKKGLLLLFTESSLTPRRRNDWMLVARAFGVAIRKEHRFNRSRSSDEGLLDGQTQRPRTPPLTSREIDVAQGILKGRSSKEIATALGISEGTVRYHRERLRRKLGITGAPESLRHALHRLQDNPHQEIYSEQNKETFN
ncbi:MAG: helix-turn-helix transcriptional regulator [Spirochaetaceae bacterium]